MARKRTPRGRNAPKLPMPRVSEDEAKWVRDQAYGSGMSISSWARDRLLAGMPGYAPPVERPRLVGSQPADGRKPFVPYDPTIRKGG